MTVNCDAGTAGCTCGSPRLVAVLSEVLISVQSAIDGTLTRPAQLTGAIRRDTTGEGSTEERDAFLATYEQEVCQARMPADGWPSVGGLQALHRGAVGNGDLRSTQIIIDGVHTFPHHGFIHPLVTDLVESHEDRRISLGPVAAAFLLHLDILTIHPFPDGNGRVARLAAAKSVALSGFFSSLFLGIDSYYTRWPSLYLRLLDSVRFGYACRHSFAIALMTCCLYNSHYVRQYLGLRSESVAIRDAMGEVPGPVAQAIAPMCEVLRTELRGGRSWEEFTGTLSPPALVEAHRQIRTWTDEQS